MSNVIKLSLRKGQNSYRKEAKELIFAVAAIFTHDKSRCPEGICDCIL